MTHPPTRMLGITSMATVLFWGTVLAVVLITTDPLGIVHAPVCEAPC